MKGYRLKISRIDWISAVDAGAQGPIANVALIKRAPSGDEYSLTAKVAKLDESIGVVFGYALASTIDGGASPHIDLQGDAVVGGDELIKIALGFAEAGARSDVMHDCIKDGWVPFVMPLSDDTKKAFGLTGDVEGIAIGMQPSPETFKRFVKGELGAFSIYGTGERTAIKSAASGKCTAGHDMPVDVKKCATCGAKQAYKRLAVAKFADGSLRVMKESVLTSETDGHVHAIDIDDPSTAWMDMYSTSYQTVEGADNGHSHSWTFDPATGAITIGADSGHTHTVAASVPADALAAYAAIDAARDAENAAVAAEIVDAPSDAVPMLVPDEKSSGAINVTIIAARNSTPVSARPHAANTTEKSQMPTEQEKQIAELTKRAEHAEKLATLTDAQRAHFGKLAGAGALAFLAKSFDERNAVLADIEKSNEVVYTAKDGSVFRKSDDPRLVAQAKQLDAQAVEIAKRDEAIEKQEIAKIAKANLAGLAGADEVHAYIVKSIRKGGGDAAMIDSALATLKSGSSFAADASKAKGFNPGTGAEDTSPQKRWDAEVAKVASEKSLTIAKATEQFATTEVGKQLYAEIQKAKQANA